MAKKTKLLFICSANVVRSRTAEDLFKDLSKYEVKSAGILAESINHLTQIHLDWADLIFVMSEEEDHHLTFLKNNFEIKDKKIEVLGIPNIYPAEGDPALIEVLRKKLVKFLTN